MKKSERIKIAKKLIAQKLTLQFMNFLMEDIVKDGEEITGKITEEEKNKIFWEVGNHIDNLYKKAFK